MWAGAPHSAVTPRLATRHRPWQHGTAMAHVAVIAPPFAGHLNPMQAIAGSLASRGHRVSFVTLPGAAGHLGQTIGQLNLVAPGLPTDFLARLKHQIGAMPPIDWWPDVKALRSLLIALAQMTRALCCEAPARLRQAGVDAILADQTEAGGGLIARHLGLPFASVANALPIDPDPEMPPIFTTWRPVQGKLGVLRNRIGYALADIMADPLNSEITQWAERWRLGRIRCLSDCLSPTLQLAQIVPALNFSHRQTLGDMVFCGPFRNGGEALPDAPPPPMAANAFVSLGTLQGGRRDLLRAMTSACQENGLHPLTVHGGGLSPKPHDGSDDLWLRDHTDHGPILAQARLTLCHGGLNTVLDSLIAGVPLLIVPLAFEQAAIARRIVAAGAGLAVSAKRSPARLAASLSRAVSEILHDPTYGICAMALGTALKQPGGATLAAQMMETVCLTPRP